MEPMLDKPPDEIFGERFERSFLRVYAYVFVRMRDHAAAQRLTRSVLIHALTALVEKDEPELSAVLVRTANQLLRAEGGRRVE